VTARVAARPSLSRRRWLLVGAACAIGLAGWAVEVGTSSASVGVFAWTMPPLMVAVWLTAPARKEARAEAFTIARVFLLLAALGYATIRIGGMHPVVVSCVTSAALRLAVLAPLVMVTGRASRALSTRWAGVRGREVAATIIGQGVPFGAWLPILILALETHRPQGQLGPEELGIRWPHERVAIRGSGGTELTGLWFENPARRGAVLLVHGIGAEKTQFLPSVETLYRRGWHVLTYDQRNHGESGGSTTTFGVAEAEDLERAWAVLLEHTRDQRIPRVVFGVSMGGAAAGLALPRLREVDGLVLDSTFADVAHVAVRRLPLGPLAGTALALARSFAVPVTGRRALDVVPAEAVQRAPAGVDVLILHAPADPLIPFAGAEALRDAYGPGATLVPLAGTAHASGAIFDGARYSAALDKFAERLETRAAAR
jgi:uncharacterized protein